MIGSLDTVLDYLFKSRVTLLRYPTPPTVEDGQVRFQPPDDAWRNHVATNLRRKALNVYLVDLRENRKLRSNERQRTLQNGLVSETPAPARLDCHYLITAESPAAEDQGKTIEEHQLLHEVTAVLLNSQPLTPRQVFAPNPLPAGFPGLIADAELPTAILPVEGFPKLAEFWGAMGQGHRWKPAVYLVVTLPVALQSAIAGPLVTTRITEYRQDGRPETAEVWIQIGGTALVGATPLRLAVGNARVMAVNGAAVTVSDSRPFQVGDMVEQNNIPPKTIRRIQGQSNILTVDPALPTSIAGRPLRIANIPPSQATFRVLDVTGLTTGGKALLRGVNANPSGQPLEDPVQIDSFDAGTGFVTLRSELARTGTYNLNVPAAQAPVLIPLLPAAGAWVGLETTAGELLHTTETNEQGRFTFNSLQAGRYRLRVRAVGWGELTPPRLVEVPSPTGEYDLQFT